LPIPLWLYIAGAGSTVALSFAAFALFLRREPRFLHRQHAWKLAGPLVGALATGARTVALGLMTLVVLAGFLGNQDPIRNIAPAMIWIVGWVGLAFASMLIGDFWALINPWSAAFALAERCLGRSRSEGATARARYPEWLGAWPAFLLLVVFAWMELVWSGKAVPAQLACALVVYSAITWLGMAVFGREIWLRHGEVFTLVFGTFARVAPFAPGNPGVCVRLPAAGLLEEHPLAISMVALTVTLLATVTFDGFLETPLWARLDLTVFDAASDPNSLFWTMLTLREDQAVRLVRTAGLIGCVLLFLLAYAIICRSIAAVSGGVSTGTIARQFVLTLVPIALAYHVAHYFSLLLIGGQYAIPLLSDPLGRGWDLFGTAAYQVDIGVVPPRLQWIVAVLAVVVGHVVAVYLSHITAMRIFRDRRAALTSEIPMVLLMVAYTMVSLWILSQPIVETGAG
jgi:hypothetical protein